MRAIKTIVKESNINPNETNDWIKLTRRVINGRKLTSKVSSTNSGYKLTLASKKDKEIIESAYKLVEDTPTDVEYIFSGNVEYKYKG